MRFACWSTNSSVDASTSRRGSRTCTRRSGRRTGTISCPSTRCGCATGRWFLNHPSCRARRGEEDVSVASAGQLPMEFPVIAPGARRRKPRFVYTLGFAGSGSGYFDAVQRLDVRDGGTHQTRIMAPGVFPSEVEFVPRRDASGDVRGGGGSRVPHLPRVSRREAPKRRRRARRRGRRGEGVGARRAAVSRPAHVPRHVQG